MDAKSAPRKKRVRKDWTNKEVRKMVAMRRNGASAKRIARELGRPLGSVKYKLTREGERRPAGGSGGKWQQWEIEVLRAEYSRRGPTDLSRSGLLPGRSRCAIGGKACIMRLTIDEDHPHYKSAQANKRKALDPNDVAKRLEGHGFKLLEPYAGYITSVLMECTACGAQERKRVGSALRGHGCLACGGGKQKTTEGANEWMEAQGLSIRAKEGNNFSGARHWGFYCLSCGFEWETAFSNIKNRGTRCRACSDRTWKEAYIYEVTRELLRDGLTATRAKYSWSVRGTTREILNQEGNRLQLDIFIGDPNVAAAIEVQGRQHYEEVALWDGTVGLAKRRRDDERKRKECARLGITLWEIDLRDFRGSEEEVKRELRECVAEFLRDTGLV